MPAPTITLSSPPTGNTDGGTIVLLFGADFTGSTAVTFGGTAATSFTVVSATRLYAVVPAHAAGAVNVAVTNPSGTGTGSNVFTYYAPVDPAYRIYLFDDCCHMWISNDTGNTFEKGCTPGNASTPAPNDPGLDPHGIGTLLDAWVDCCMAINDEDYETVVGVDYDYDDTPNSYGIIARSDDGGRNQTWTLLDPEVNSPAFVNGSTYMSFARGAASSGADTILLATRDSTLFDYTIYPRISRDGGATWSNVTGVTADLFWSMVCFGSESSEVMYLKESVRNGLAARIWKSTDWGVTWTKLAGGPVFTGFQNAEDEGHCQRMRCSADGQTIVVSNSDGHLWVSTNGGSSWTDNDFTSQYIGTPNNVVNTASSDCSVTPDGQTIIVSFEQIINSGIWPAVFVSTNGGSSFTQVTNNLQYPASLGGTPTSPPPANTSGCNGCNVAPDGLGMVVTFHTPLDNGIIEPDGLQGKVMYANISIDAGTTWRLVSYDADPYESGSFLGLFTAVYITPTSSPTPPPSGAGAAAYYIERMDNRIWPTIEDAWCLDSALELEQPTPDAMLAVSSATGDGAIRSYNIINGGSGYTAPIGQVSDAAATGSGATVALGVSGGIIVSAAAVLIGANYRSPSLLAVLDTTGVGAVIQPLVTNYTTLSTNTSSFTASDVGSIVRVGGGRIEIVTVSTVTSSIGNVLSPITDTIPNDPNNTPVVATSGEWTMTAPVTTVSGLWHLEGLTVSALADGGVVNDLVVANGSVTLPVSASQILVGLPFIAQLQTMYLDAGAGPTVQGRRKSNPQVIIRVEDSRPMEIGVNQPDAAAQPNQATVDWTQMTEVKFRTPNMPAGTPLPLYSGDFEPTNLFGGYDTRGQIAIQQTDPLPLTVLAVVIQTTIGDDPSK